jgi:hypothetical protein
VRWNVTTLLDFGASQYTAQASISLRRFSNASLRRHIQRLKRDLIAQLERFGLPGSPRLQKAKFDGQREQQRRSTACQVAGKPIGSAFALLELI